MDNERTYCPVCGHDFYDEVRDEQDCPNCGTKEITREELISDDDDYAWCY